MKLEYDKTSPASIENYAQGLINKTFQDVLDEDASASGEVQEAQTYGQNHEAKKYKGGLGTLIEEKYFHYKANSDSNPDFKEAGVELKVTPYKVSKKGELSAKERLVITMIDYMHVVDEIFESSHVWNKSRLMLIVYYRYDAAIKNRLFYPIHYAKLFTPPEKDRKIIMHDFELIQGKIRSGLAHELSEGDTLYLSACTKSSDSSKRRQQPYSTIPAKPRAFSFKTSYMTYVLNNFIVPGKTTYESITDENGENDFESYVTNKLHQYAGKSVEELCSLFEVDVSKSKPKNLESILAFRMLGIKGNKAEEFEKANVVVKTIRIGNNDRIKENMSFPTFKFKELLEETWEDSTFGNYLRDTRFFFVVFKFDKDNILRLKGGQFWNIKYDDLENEVRKVWEKTQAVIREGLVIEQVGNKTRNNLPKQTENPVCHVRPHGQNAKDTYELPDGREYTKQCFWLNNNYIYEQLDEQLTGD